MSAPVHTQPAIVPVNPDGIPQAMRNRKRWCVWEAVWIPERGKYDKRPIHPVSGQGLSSRIPEAWSSFEQAYAAYRANMGTGKGKYAGIGFVIAKGDNIFCIDLDKCIHNGKPDARARDVIVSVSAFTEQSPSGQGAHIWGEGTIDQDCVKGVEVYQGNGARYVTVTGVAVPEVDSAWRKVPTTVLQSVIDTYGQRKSATDTDAGQYPEILDPLTLPDVSELDLPYTVADFLNDGELGTKDRSLMLFQTAIALHNTGITAQEVFSMMANNHHSLAAAMGKRNEDYDRALDYLWQHHVHKAKPKSDASRVTLDDFEDLSAPDLGEADMGIPISETNDMFDDESANQPPAAAQPPSKLKYQFLQAADYSSGIAPLEWLVRNLLPKAEVGVCYGASGAGKSFFVMDICMSIARGERWRGKHTRKGRVAYIVAEGARGFKLRMDAYADHHGINLSELSFHALPAAPNVLDKADVKELIAALKALGPLDLIVIDTVAQVTPGADENSGQDMGRMLAHCKAIHRATSAMVLLVGHTGKDETRGMRGWSGVKGALDVELEVTRSLHYRAATVTKMKDGTGEGNEYPFKLEVVTMGQETDEDGEIHDITSCVLVEVQAQSNAGKPPHGATERLVLGTLQDLVELAGPAKVETLITEAAAKKAPPDAGKKDQRRRDVRRALDGLVASGRVKVDGDLVEPT